MNKILKLLKNTKFKFIIILTFLLYIYTTICAFSYAKNVSTNIADSVFRLHVIANSNSEEDQNLKYIVRDNLLEYMNSLCKNCTSKSEATYLVEKNKETFYNIALNTIRKEGYSYDVKINIGNFNFPTKNYGNISLPAGYYDALRVEIGTANGENWWCVMFPPLCFVDISSGIISEESEEQLQDSLTEEEFALVSENSNFKLKFKFKILEFFNQSGLNTAKNSK